MASSSCLCAGVHGLGSHIIRSLSDSNCSKKRNVQAEPFFYPIQRQLLNQRNNERCRPFKAASGGDQASDNESQGDDTSSENLSQEMQDSLFRKKLEDIIGDDDAKFSGRDLAMLIRNKYGRSYDVQLIKKEFMGRQLLAMNVMWKYREQRSFPLTEEEYLLRLDDVANNLRCWGAVSYIRSSLAKTKERPRIGKAVSIFIDLDESGGRANEWIYR